MADAASRDADELFERLTTRFTSEPSVSQGTGFGSSPGLRVRSKIFAMLAGDALVVKLPKNRVDQLVAAGVGARFDPGHGRVMKEWVTVPVDQADDWDKLAADAFAYVSGRSLNPDRVRLVSSRGASDSRSAPSAVQGEFGRLIGRLGRLG